MKLTFLGTRGNIDARTRRHRMHSSLLVSYYRNRVMIDCGIVTHCGSEIVEADERKLGAELRQMAEERGVEAQIAYDSLEVVLR